MSVLEPAVRSKEKFHFFLKYRLPIIFCLQKPETNTNKITQTKIQNFMLIYFRFKNKVMLEIKIGRGDDFALQPRSCADKSKRLQNSFVFCRLKRQQL
ncbi:hypothetical protein COP00_19970 [Bacillus glycinifermentans]|uniref:Uncharacterized protein n=1 Tax=Bacillus glycinifermentans TaxID=1664069 RepID=A0A0T6BPX2_9BACI|nr:hypothetical protein COP00_19970 [Bacillus glycinifermentans]KRT93684.1 hypothetical protein AB447_217985 [Bacillus glycinifermentans]